MLPLHSAWRNNLHLRMYPVTGNSTSNDGANHSNAHPNKYGITAPGGEDGV